MTVHLGNTENNNTLKHEYHNFFLINENKLEARKQNYFSCFHYDIWNDMKETQFYHS